MTLTRRRFLAHSGLVTVAAAGASLGLDLFSPLGEAAGAATLKSFGPLPLGTPILVLIDLQGGNDATNMLIDPTDPWYYDVPKGHGSIAIQESAVLPLSGITHGLHPSMPWLASRWASNHDVAFVLGPGENVVHEFSHFAAMHYRQVADFTGAVGTGWLGRFNDLAASGSPFASVSIVGVHPSLVGTKTPVLTVPSVEYFDFNVDWRWQDGWLSAWRAMGGDGAARGTMTRSSEVAIADTFAAQSKVFAASDDAVAAGFDNTDVGQQLAQVALLVDAGIPSQTYVVTIGGFDTHGEEDGTQPTLYGQLDSALGQFFDVVGAGPRANDVFVYATSEFGRQQTANGSAGCDHGQAGVDLIVGGGVHGGLYGEAPASAPGARLDDALVPTVDFRSVYATILNHLGRSPSTSTPVLFKHFEDLGVFAA
jgi:uncharacterized protein (DUF1501 family)